MSLKTRNKVSVEFSMSSMTDIVFLLLIFFMITSTLISPTAVNLALPNSNHQTDAKPQIQVFISRKLEYTIQRNETVLPFKKVEIESVLNQFMQMDNDAYIALNAEKGVPIKHVVEVMNIAKNNGYKLILRTNPKSR